MAKLFKEDSSSPLVWSWLWGTQLLKPERKAESSEKKEEVVSIWASQPERGGDKNHGTSGSIQHPPARVYAVDADSQTENFQNLEVFSVRVVPYIVLCSFFCVWFQELDTTSRVSSA